MDNCSLHYSSQYWGDQDGPIVGWLLGADTLGTGVIQASFHWCGTDAVANDKLKS